jgi:hypothetical protein
MAMLLTQQKPTQTDRLLTALLLDANGEVREGLPESTLERGMREERTPGTFLNEGGSALLAPALLEDREEA